MSWLAVAIGGALGSMARYAVSRAVFEWAPVALPLGTAAVNLVGCFVIGLLAGLLAAERIAFAAAGREFVFVGLIGGFTTFSAFGLDTFLLAHDHAPGWAVINAVGQVVGGLLAVGLGYQVGVVR